MSQASPVCPSCGTPIPAGALYCVSCGASTPTEIAPTIPEGVTRASPLPETEPARRPSLAGPEIEKRRATVQEALGSGFEVRGLIGRGGFGEVWAAVDNQLGRDVAVKVLRPEIGANPDYRARFRRETRAIAMLRHPGIVPIYHVGEASGTVYFIMPLVEGITLRAALADPAGLTNEDALRILIEASAALREAHLHGIIHRDIKPENIMLEGPARRALLMDFGVAKVEGNSEEGITETDTVIGSPEYMSPEQATGRALDARSDIYSLGVVAYRMLSGRLPFDADTPREVLAHHVLTPPEPLSAHASVSGAVSAAVMKCLAKAPGERWDSADAFGKALSTAAPRASAMAVRTQELDEPPPKPEAISHQPSAISRRRLIAIFAGVVLLGLAAAAPWPIARWRQQRQWSAASALIVRQYQDGLDSLLRLSSLFVRGDLTAAQLLAANTDVLSGTDAAIEETHGAALDDSTRWLAETRRAVRQAARSFAAAGASATAFSLRAGDVPGCRLTGGGDFTRLADEAPRDNCWFAAEAVTPRASPVEYFARFRVTRPLPADGGIGLAWCRPTGECRIAFLWSRAPAVWGMHRPQRGLSVIQLTRRLALAPGDHEVRLRYQDGVIRAWLDGGVFLERASTADAVFFEAPASFNVVVQNTGVLLDEIGAAGSHGRQ